MKPLIFLCCWNFWNKFHCSNYGIPFYILGECCVLSRFSLFACRIWRGKEVQLAMLSFLLRHLGDFFGWLALGDVHDVFLFLIQGCNDKRWTHIAVGRILNLYTNHTALDVLLCILEIGVMLYILDIGYIVVYTWHCCHSHFASRQFQFLVPQTLCTTECSLCCQGLQIR